jgi:hypothetical protein
MDTTSQQRTRREMEVMHLIPFLIVAIPLYHITFKLEYCLANAACMVCMMVMVWLME